MSDTSNNVHIREISPGEFSQYMQDIARVYERAFGGIPWNIHYQPGDVLQRIGLHTKMSGFKAFLAFRGNAIVGALWRDVPSRKSFISEFPELEKQLTVLVGSRDKTIIYERELFVDPGYHCNGIATALRKTFLADSHRQFPNGAIIFTRMRETNEGIISVAKKVGIEYIPTAITSVGNNNTATPKEWINRMWYKVLG